ncbi:MAG: AMP-binding protein [Chloroflexota bacterium]
MIETAFAQLRFAASMLFGTRFSLRSLDRMISAALETRREFGAVGAEGAELVAGPTLDEETRRDVQLRRFRKQATLGARETAYYAEVFKQEGLDPAHLAYDDITRIPLTPKEAIRDNPDAFVRRNARHALRTTTSGTTGRPTHVCFSQYELAVTIALGAMSSILDNSITSEDIVQISSSSRATLGNLCFAGACTRLGALVCPVGLVAPEMTLSLLREEHHITGKKPHVSVVFTYPSYLGEIVERGLSLGYGPGDFGLERIVAGGEIVSEGLKARARRLFGEVRFDQGYGITELWPLGGRVCSQGHLHFEVSQGLIQVISPDTGAPAEDGQAGTIVGTPFAPYRDSTVVLRYDTQDMVRPIAGPLDCSMKNLPATSNLLGKLGLSVRHDTGWTFPREVVEALEAVEEVRLPARCGFWAVPGGVAVEVVVRGDQALARRKIESSLEDYGVPLRELHLLDDRSRLRKPLLWRGDLRELTFGTHSMGDGRRTMGEIADN